jgi:hypothetical protein
VVEGDTILTPSVLGGICRFDVYTADILDNKYALIGSERGLFFLELSKPRVEPIPLIRDVRFQQIEVLTDYGVMVALSGRHNHIRQYKLSSLRKLIKYILGTSAAVLAKTNMNNPEMETPDGPSTPAKDDDDLYKNLHDTIEDEAVLVAKWTRDYIKILNTKDSKSFLITHTETSIFMGVLFRQDVILFEWAREPYLKFMKLRAFWLPETPKFMNLLHDGLIVREVYMAYGGEANLVKVDDSKVREVEVHRDFSKASPRGSRWQGFSQIPFSDAKKSELRTLSRPTTTINRKLAAVAGSGAANSSASVDRYFLATYHRLTKVVDLASQPMMGSGVGGWKDGVTWMEPPADFVLRPVDHVIAVGKSSIEVADWKSAQIVQALKAEPGSIIKLAAHRQDGFVVIVERKRKEFVVYHMKEKPKPPQEKSAATSPQNGTPPIKAAEAGSDAMV